MQINMFIASILFITSFTAMAIEETEFISIEKKMHLKLESIGLD